MTDDQFKDFIALAWARVNEMDAVDRNHGNTLPHLCPEVAFVGTVLSAIRAGIQSGGNDGLDCIADAYVMLLQRQQQLRVR